MTQIVNDFVIKNLIYCEDTHSFVHRLFQKFLIKMPLDYKEAQNMAWQVVEEMNLYEDVEKVKGEVKNE